MYWDHMGSVGGMHALWWLFWLVLVGLAVWGLLSLGPRSRRRDRESPHEVLRRRLAAGEITPEVYERTKAILDRDTGPR